MNSQENYRTITDVDVVNIFEKLKLENIVTYLSDCIILRRKYDNILVYIFNKDELIIDKSDIEYIINQRIAATLATPFRITYGKTCFSPLRYRAYNRHSFLTKGQENGTSGAGTHRGRHGGL